MRSLLKQEPWSVFPGTSGIYAIWHRSGHVYVGSAKNLKARIRKHCGTLVAGTHPNKYLLATWRRDGLTAFSFSILELTSIDRLVEREQTYIDGLRAADQRYGYNVYPIARSPLGHHHSAEARARMSAAAKRRLPVSELTRARMSLAHVGVKRNPEIGQKTAASQRGRHMPLEQRARISETLTGRKHLLETKAKIAASCAAWWTQERREVASIRQARLNHGRKLSAESRIRIASKLRGRKPSIQSRVKMSESQLRRWVTRRLTAA